jgi:predicted DsbA family dithiol-disulfide isomerase
MTRELAIGIASGVVCPWCSIGKRRLEKALSLLGRGPQVVDALFRAYFEEARDIGDRDVLASIAMGSGVSGWPGQAHPQEAPAK